MKKGRLEGPWGQGDQPGSIPDVSYTYCSSSVLSKTLKTTLRPYLPSRPAHRLPEDGCPHLALPLQHLPQKASLSQNKHPESPSAMPLPFTVSPRQNSGADGPA